MVISKSIRAVAFGRGTLVTVSTVSKLLTRAGLFLIIAPILGPMAQGTLVVLSAYAATIGLLVAYGFQVRVLRHIPTEPERACSIIKSNLAGMAALSAPTTLIAAALGSVLVAPADHLAFGLIFFAVLASILGDYVAAALRALDEYRIETGVAFVSAAAQFTLVVSAALLFGSLVAVGATLLASRAFALAVGLYAVFSRPRIRAASQRAIEPIHRVLWSTRQYFLDASLSVAASQADVLILSAFVSHATIGTYSAGSRLVQLTLTFPWIVTNAVVPKIVAQTDPVLRAREIGRLTAVMALGAAAGLILVLAGGPLFTHHLLGPEFAGLDRLWPLFALMLLCLFFDSYFSILMLVEDRMKERAAAQGAGLAGTLGLGALAAWQFGAEGMICVLAVVALTKGLWFAWRLSAVRSKTGAATPLAPATLYMVVAAFMLIAGALLSRVNA